MIVKLKGDLGYEEHDEVPFLDEPALKRKPGIIQQMKDGVKDEIAMMQRNMGYHHVDDKVYPIENGVA